MTVGNDGLILYFLMAFGSGYAIGNFQRIGFLTSWILSVLFVPLAYELLNPNFLMVITVIGFSLGLFYAKSLFFYNVLNYLNPKKILKLHKKEKNFSQRQPQFFSFDEIDAFDKRTPEQILGLSTDFSQDELKVAYQRESNRTHPDKWQNKPESVRKIMETEQKRINWAYEKLKR